MTTSRAKKKARRRARAAAAGTGAPGGAATAAERAAARAAERRERTEPPAERPRPSRLEERDGVRRPPAPWGPVPLTELGMAVGIALFAIGFFTAGRTAAVLLAIGLAVLAAATAELCLREHFGGFRSHSVLLGLLPVTIVHTLVVVAVTDAWRGPVALVVDLAVAGALAWWLQRRFRAAQARAQARR